MSNNAKFYSGHARDEEVVALRARVAELEAALLCDQEQPVAYEFQGRDGVWRPFINEEHRKNTVEDGTWLVRALYTRPANAFTPPFRFCPRCGKDLKDLPIHTCTPPREDGEVALSLAGVERECCGTFKGSPRRATCEKYKGKKGGA